MMSASAFLYVCIALGLIKAVHAGALITDQTEQRMIIRSTTDQIIGTAIGGIENTTQTARNFGAPQWMRCWQNGILILEQSVLAPKDKLTDYRLMQNPDKKNSISSLDFKNALCYIQ